MYESTREIAKKIKINTNISFSDSFACCGHHELCDMGKGTCVYAASNPSIQESCMAWQRRDQQQPLVQKERVEKNSPSLEILPHSKDQLSLFD